MNIQAKVALDKQRHPERFCAVARCLWRVTSRNPMTGERTPNADCPGGYCPRHQGERPCQK
jgi:hypothetical protein